MWTLDQVIQECASNLLLEDVLQRAPGGGYASTGLQYAKRLASGINYANRKVAREMQGPEHVEVVTLDSDSRFAVADLTYDCIRIKSVMYETYQVPYDAQPDNYVLVPYMQGLDVTVVYQYLPDELDPVTDLDVEINADDRYIDPRIFAQYANYQFLSEEGTTYDSARAEVWLNLFNDSFYNIENTNKRPKRVRYNG